MWEKFQLSQSPSSVFNRCSLPKAISISRSEILRKSGGGGDLRLFSEIWFLKSGFGLGHSASFELLSFLRFWEVSQLSEKLLTKVKKTQKLKTCRTPTQSFVILESLLRWRWQWASIGHYVFLFGNIRHIFDNYTKKIFVPQHLNTFHLVQSEVKFKNLDHNSAKTRPLLLEILKPSNYSL